MSLFTQWLSLNKTDGIDKFVGVKSRSVPNCRVENATMHHMREVLVRDHELVCRENERLLKKLDAMEKYVCVAD